MRSISFISLIAACILGTKAFASALAEDPGMAPDRSSASLSGTVKNPPFAEPGAVVEGIVTHVDDEEFLVDTGAHEVRVNVSEMPYNPLVDEGRYKIEKGDRVRVTGRMEDTLLIAESVVGLAR